VALTDGAILAIKDMISSGRLGPGDRLPREPELAAQLNVSRNSLREAVRALTHVRVLTTRQGDGTYVTSLEPELLLEAVGLVSELVLDHTLLELFEVRRILEPAATALATRHMTPDVLEELGASLGRMLAADSVDALLAGDLEFHRIIAEASGNRTLASLIGNLGGGTVRVRTWRGVVEEGATEETRVQHQAIYRAIVAGDPDIARAAATMHLASGELWLRRALADPSPGRASPRPGAAADQSGGLGVVDVDVDGRRRGLAVDGD